MINPVINIPDDATLKDIIIILNHMKLVAQTDDKRSEFQKWLYEHQHWLKSGEE